MMTNNMEMDNINQDSASSPRPDIPRNSGPKTEDEVDERDITDYTLPQWQWSRSTDELLAPCIPSSPRSSFYSVVTTIPDDDIQPNPEACAGQFSRLPVPPIRVQLADQQSNGMEAEARTIYNPNPYPCQSGLRLEMSGDDLELQDITVQYPASRTQSTDQLVSNDNPAQLDESSTANPKFPDEQPPTDRTCAAKTTGQTPDWKPLSIRWPFQMLLLVIMAGLVAFFEYQVHDLPPVQYTMIQLKPPAEGQRLEQGAVNATTTLSSAQLPLQTPSPGVRGASLPTSTSSSDSPSFAKPNIMVAAPAPAPTPEPDPRPPEDAYPRPPILFSTRCGYKKPEWLVFQESFVRNPQMILKQVIPTFFTDDETWCPCYVELKAWTNATELTWSGDWGNMIYVKRTTSTRTEFSVTRAVAFDKECQTIMSLVFQHNNNYINDFLDGRAGSCYHRHGDGHVMTITPGSVSLPGGTAITPSLFSTSTMTLSEQPIGVADWEWPKTDTQGNVQFLVDLRDVSSSLLRSRATNECVFQTLDAFGNKFDVQPYTGFWFASHATTTGPNTLRRDWWTLPFSYASAVPSTAISTESEKVGSSTAQAKDSTSLSTEAPTTVVSTSPAPNTLSSLMEMSSRVTTQDQPKSSETMTSATDANSTSSSTSTMESSARTASSTASHDQANNSTSISGIPLIAVPQSPSPDTRLTNIPGKTLSGGRSSSSSPAMRSTTRVGIIVSTSLSSPAVLESTGQSATLRTTVISPSPEQEEQPRTSGILHVVNGTSSSERTREANPTRTINTPEEHTDKSFVARPTTESSNATKPPILTSMTIHHSPNITADLRPTPERGAPNSLSRAKIKSAPQFTLQGSNTNTSTQSSPMRVMPGTKTRKYSDPSSPSHSHAIMDPILANATTSTTADTPKLTEMPKGPIAPGKGSSFANLRSDADFFMASLAPVILATVLSIAIQVFTSSVSSMLPFRALGNSSSDGARAEDTLTLSRNTGLWGLAGFRLLSRYRDVLSLINVLLGLLAAALVPVSSEVIRLEFSQYCGTSTERKNFADIPEVLPGHNMVCAYGLRKSGPTMRLAEGIVAVMALILCGMGYIIFRWRTGVGTEPWSIASMAALLVSSDYRIRDALLSIDAPPLPNTSRGVNNGQTGAEIKQAFQGKRFRIGWFSPQPEVIRQTTTATTATTTTNYGIYMVNGPVLQDRSSIRVTTRDPPPPPRSRTKYQTSRGNISQRRWWRHIIVPPQHKEKVLLSIALFLTMALLVLILYYENTISPDTKFEMFMNSQTFGVRILFTSLGTAATWFWDYYFSYTSSRAVYTRLLKQAHGKPEGEPARSSILLSPPTNVFLGIYQSAILLITATTTTTSDNKKRRLGMIVRGLSIALVALLAKFTPILFANIPFRDTVTFRMHEVCTWLAVFVLGCMVLVLCVSIWVNAMHEKITLPVMPDTIVGGMYYLAGARMLRDFDGMVLLGVSAKTRKRERDRMVSSMERMYGFGELQIKQVPREDQRDIDHITFKGETKRLRQLRVDYI